MIENRYFRTIARAGGIRHTLNMTTRNATSLQLIDTVSPELAYGSKFGPNDRYTRVAPTGCFPFAAADNLFHAEEAIMFGLTLDELVNNCNMRLAFEAVQSERHWKAPVDALILTAHMDVVARAIEHFTATKAEFTPVGDGSTFQHVRAAGYWAGPAA